MSIRQEWRNKRGFSTLLLTLLAFIFFLIAGSVGYLIQSENDQKAAEARSSTGMGRLNFIAQTIQIDFFNNFLQNKFESTVVEFLSTGTHAIDPNRSFRQNLGGELSDWLSEAMEGIASGEASRVYSRAYSALPSISCTPGEVPGAIAKANLRESKDVIRVGGMSIGQSIICEDSEAGQKLSIDLIGREYELRTRAIQIHDKAVEAINLAKIQLDKTEGVARITSGWRVYNDESVLPEVLKAWNSRMVLLSALLSLSDTDGIVVKPLSVVVRNGENQPFNVNDLEFSCTGEVKTAVEGGPQTCRADNLEVVIGAGPEEGAERVEKLRFSEGGDPEREVTVTIAEAGIELKIPVPGVENLVKNLLEKLRNPLTNGYLDYSGSVTHLCNQFKGRAREATISGKVLETNKDFLPLGRSNIEFSFVSTKQILETSDIDSGVDCDDEQYEEIIKLNALDMLSRGKKGVELFRIIVKNKNGELEIDQEELNKLQEQISQHPLSQTGENRQVTLQTRIEGGGVTRAEGSSSGTHGVVSASEANAVRAINRGSASTTESETGSLKTLRDSLNSADKYAGYLASMDLYGEATSALIASGHVEDAEALGKASAAVCKMAGLKNWMEMGNEAMALMALCGVASISKEKTSGKIYCTLASLYQVVETGSLQGVLSVLAQLLSDGGYEAVIASEYIAAAVQSGNVEDVLAAAAAFAAMEGETEAADFLYGLASVARGVKKEDVLGMAAGVYLMAGEEDLASFLFAANDLSRAIENGDFARALNAISRMAKNLDYSGSSEVVATIGQAVGVVNTVMNLDKMRAECDGVPWDFICTADVVGGGVCGQPSPLYQSWGCKFKYGLPTIDIRLLCDDLVYGMGAKVDCTCVYTCVDAPEILCPGGMCFVPRSAGIDVKQFLMRMDLPPELYDLYKLYGLYEKAKTIEQLLKSGKNLLDYCKLDP